MSLSRSNSQSQVSPPPPSYIPDSPGAPSHIPLTPAQAKAAAQAKARLENGFAREAVKPRGNARALRQLVKQQDHRAVAESMQEPELSAYFTAGAHPADAFCFLLTPLEKEHLLAATASDPRELQAFQDLMSGKSCNLKEAQAFAQKWCQLPTPHAKKLLDLPGYALVDERANALVTAGGRISFVHSDVNFQTHGLNPEYDLCALVKPQEQDDSDSKPAVVGILNPASRSGWGKSGASKAIQDGARGTEFQRRQKAMYEGRTNLVGNAPVGQAYVVPVSDDKVVFSVAGPNHKHHTGLRIKLPRLSHLLKPNHVSKSQESKLRAAYRTFFASVDQYNADASLTGKDAVNKLHMVPISANVFGFPKDKAASVMAEEILRYTAQNPVIQVQVLAVNDKELAGHINTAFDPLGVTTSTDKGTVKV